MFLVHFQKEKQLLSFFFLVSSYFYWLIRKENCFPWPIIGQNHLLEVLRHTISCINLLKDKELSLPW